MNGIGWLLGLLALETAQRSQTREDAWRAIHRRPDAPPLAPPSHRPHADADSTRPTAIRRSPSTIGALARRW